MFFQCLPYSLCDCECFFQKPGVQEPSEEEEGLKHIDPLHQLIQLFSRTALTEKWWVLVDICKDKSLAHVSAPTYSKLKVMSAVVPKLGDPRGGPEL